MFKVMIGAARRRGLTRHEMHSHAATTHAGLVKAAPNVERITRYTQTQVVDSARGSAVEHEFDLVPELSFVDHAAFLSVGGTDYFKQKIAADESQFGDLDSRRFLFVDEEVAASPVAEACEVKALVYLVSAEPVGEFLSRWRALDAAFLAATAGSPLGLIRNLPLALEGLPQPFCAGVTALFMAPVGSRQLIRDYRAAWRDTASLDEAHGFHVEGRELTII